jgi:hypothetical protein
MNTGQFNIHDEGFTEDQKQRVKEDLFDVLNKTIGEVSALLEAVKAGKINGSVYVGECSCLMGTLAKSSPYYSLWWAFLEKTALLGATYSKPKEWYGRVIDQYSPIENWVTSPRLVIRRRTIRFQKIWQRGLKNGLHQTL